MSKHKSSAPKHGGGKSRKNLFKNGVRKLQETSDALTETLEKAKQKKATDEEISQEFLNIWSNFADDKDEIIKSLQEELKNSQEDLSHEIEATNNQRAIITEKNQIIEAQEQEITNLFGLASSLQRQLNDATDIFTKTKQENKELSKKLSEASVLLMAIQQATASFQPGRQTANTTADSRHSDTMIGRKETNPFEEATNGSSTPPPLSPSHNLGRQFDEKGNPTSPGGASTAQNRGNDVCPDSNLDINADKERLKTGTNQLRGTNDPATPIGSPKDGATLKRY